MCLYTGMFAKQNTSKSPFQSQAAMHAPCVSVCFAMSREFEKKAGPRVSQLLLLQSLSAWTPRCINFAEALGEALGSARHKARHLRMLLLAASLDHSHSQSMALATHRAHMRTSAHLPHAGTPFDTETRLNPGVSCVVHWLPRCQWPTLACPRIKDL